MPNTLANPEWVIKDVGRNYLNEIIFIKQVSKSYDPQYRQAGAKMGDTVKARLPQRYVVSDGPLLVTQALQDRTVPISLGPQKHIGFSYSSREASLNLDDIRNRYVMPAAEALASAADRYAFENVYFKVYNSIGTPGTPPSDKLTYLRGGVILTDMASPGMRKAVLDPDQMAVLSNTLLTLFHPSGTVEGAFKKGKVGGAALNIAEWYEDANRATHTTGTFTASTPLVDGANQTGSTININGWASGATTLKKGDVFTIAGVYRVNPQGYQNTGRLQQFVVTADTSDSSGATATLPISPSIITSGSLQTVSASPANDAVVTVWSTASGGALDTTASPTGLIFVEDAIAWVMADLDEPTAGCESRSVRSTKGGFSIRYVEQYQIGTDQNPSRLDFIAGVEPVRPEWVVRVQG